MNRVFALIVVSSLWLLPTSSAFAGTWSWHSDFVQKIIEVVQNQQTRVKDLAQNKGTTSDAARTTGPRTSSHAPQRPSR